MRPLLLAVLLLALTACAPPPLPPEKADTAPVVAGNSKFAFDLYRHLAAKEQGNLFVSPYSISSALAMTYVGAKGKTAAEMRQVLAFPADEKLHAGFRYLDWELNEPGKKRGYQLAVANRLWGQKGFGWRQEFRATTAKFYGAGLEEVDFGETEKSRLTINAWVAKQTQERIAELLAKGILNPDAVLVLTNAIYFKGDWASQFKKDRTKPGPFRLGGEKSVPVPLMNQTARFAYAQDGAVQVVKLPYVGKELEMVVLLPRKVDGLAEVEKTLTPDKLKGWLDNARTESVAVTLPKFKVATGYRLEQELATLGMPSAFSLTTADFSGLAGARGLFIGAVVHKAFVEVNEEGSEAAAATAVVIFKDKGGPGPEEARIFRADHPFVYLIRDSRSGSILFLGRYAGPG